MKGDNSPLPSRGPIRFHLFYEHMKIGELCYAGGSWTFEYSDSFRKSKLRTITEFPDRDKKYSSNELWPFFLMRIPSSRRDSIKRIMAKEQVDEHDEARLLDLFGRRTVANPFELIKVEDESEPQGFAMAR
jgi:HipA-like protein